MCIRDRYDAVEDLKAHGVDVQDHSAELDEARDINDPAMVRYRAAKIKRDKFAGSDPKAGSTIKSTGFDPIILKLKAKRAQIMSDMEQEAEPEGGPIADKYGDMLNKIDAAIAKARGLKEDDDYETDYVKRRKEADDYYEDPDYYKEEKDTDDYGRPHVDPKGSRTFLEPDEMLPHNRFKKMAQKEDKDIGHQDDEPDMLQSTAFETAQYAAKLVKKLQKYNQHDGEVDFPNWWQSKLTLAKDYLQKAYHYLDSEEKTDES